MALVGYREWRTVGTDTIGVPKGGRYGNVEWFEREAAKHGLYIGFNLVRRCFVLFSRMGPNGYVMQLPFINQQTMKPVPLTEKALHTILLVRERFCRTSATTIKQGMARAQREQKEQVAKEAYEAIKDREKDRVKWAGIRLGRRTPKAFSIPTR